MRRLKLQTYLTNLHLRQIIGTHHNKSHTEHGEINKILCPLQHGFRKDRSCETQLVEFTSNLENGKQTDVLVMDFAKAFDKVHHSLLVHKLYHYGIRGNPNKWSQAFLSDITQTVVLDATTSYTADVDSVTPGLSSWPFTFPLLH